MILEKFNKMDLTLVTCWWDLEARGAPKGRRDFEKLSRPVLGLPLPMVIYCDPWVAEKISKIRGDALSCGKTVEYLKTFSCPPTHIISMLFEHTEAVQLWGERIKTCELPKKRNEAKDTHMFFNMGWGKPLLMAKVAAMNPFNTPVIGWIDLAISHPNAASEASIRELANYKWDGDPRVRLHALRCFHGFPEQPDFYHAIWGLIAAGFMVGGREEITKFVSKFKDEVERVLQGGHTTIDEELLAALANREPEAYTYSYGNYCDIISNHQGSVHNLDHLRWMIKDARDRGFPKFAEQLEEGIGKAPISLTTKLDAPEHNLIKLHMIVKNESRKIRETLESVKPWIDSFCILDTGSTDGTQNIIRETMKDVPGDLFERNIIPYADTGIIDYAATRNLGLDLAGTDATFLLLLNGDDILQNGEALRRYCLDHGNDIEAAHYMNIRGELGLGFIYPRLVKSSANWRYTMPTHEIISGNTPVDGTIPDAWILKCEDPADVRFARWEKDRVILEAWLMKHSDDHRGLYYLAQTHECLGQSTTKTKEECCGHKLRAVSLYMRRSELGGWQDEVFESCMRAGNLLEQLGNRWAEAQELFLQAFSHAPYRAEPLARIAQHWLNKNSPAVAYPFALRASEISIPPPGALNPNPHLYQTEIPDLLSRSAFYIGQKKVGYIAARKAAISQPDNVNLRRNFHFYTPTLKEIIGEDFYREIDIAPPLEPTWTPSTPSICIAGKVMAIVRTVNYKIKSDGSYDYDGTIRTRNYLAYLSEQLVPEKFVEILDKTNAPRTEFPVHGFEDCRLFFWRNSYWAVATVRDVTEDGHCIQVQLRLEGVAEGNPCFTEMTLLEGLWDNKQHQKNWKPVVEGDLLRWIYSTDPLCVIKPDVRNLTEHSGRLLGSSQAVQLPSGNWLWVDHEVSWNEKGRERIYVHRFVLADQQLSRVLITSDPFYFKELGIEFCAGLALTAEKELVLSYSVHDASSRLAIVPLATVLSFVGL